MSRKTGTRISKFSFFSLILLTLLIILLQSCKHKDMSNLENEQGSSSSAGVIYPAENVALSGLPAALTNTNSIDITVSSPNLLSFRYKIISGAACSTGGYSTETGKDIHITQTFATDGQYTICVLGKNISGNWQADTAPTSYTWTIDTTPPVITLTGKPSILTNSTSIDLTVSGADTAAYKFKLNSSQTCAGGTYSAEIPVATHIIRTDLTNGQYTVCIMGKDAIGNWQTEASVTSYSWIVDTNPTQAVLSNTPFAATNITATDITVAGSNIISYKYKIVSGSDCSTGTYGAEYTIDTGIKETSLSNGQKTLCVLGKNIINNWQIETNPTVYTWLIDTVAPAAALTGTPASLTNATGINVKVEGAEVVKYKYKLVSGANCAGGTYGVETDSVLNIILSGLANGQYTLCVLGKDSAGNLQPEGSPTSYTWTIDSTAPSAVLTGAPDYQTALNTIDITVGGINITHYKYKLISGTDCSSGSFGAETAVSAHISASGITEGQHSLCVVGKNSAGSWQADMNVTVYTWTIDNSAPTGGSIVINGNAAYTATTAVSLTLSASDSLTGLKDMRFSNNGSSWSLWETYLSTKTNWDITSATYGGTTANGSKTVYAQFRDNAGNTTANITKTIIFDNTGPTGSININAGASYTGNAAVSLSLITNDGSGSGLAQMRFSNNGTNWSTWETYASAKSGWNMTEVSYGGATGDGNKTVYVQYKDNAGNTSIFSRNIGLDTTAPTGSIAFTGNLLYTNNANASIDLSSADTGGSGVAQMRFSNNGSIWSSWETYAANKTNWNMTEAAYGGTTTEGSKTVFVQYSDNIGNVSVSYSKTISYDITAPSGTVGFIADYTNNTVINIDVNANDTGSSGLYQMRFSNDGLSWSAWEVYSSAKTGWDLTDTAYGGIAGGGMKTVYLQISDNAGNLSSVTNNTISYYPVVDSTADLYPTALTDITGTHDYQNLRVLNTKDMIGTLINPNRFIVLRPAAGSIYEGVIDFTIPNGMVVSDINHLAIKTNYKGPNSLAYQTWQWKIFDNNTLQWETIGDNSFAVNDSWSSQTWTRSSSVSSYINATKTIKIKFISNNSVDIAYLDWLMITATLKSNSHFPAFSQIPYSIGLAIDKLGNKDFGPPDNTRNAVISDYQTLINIAKNSGTRIMCAWIIGQFDPSSILANPIYNPPNNASYMTGDGLEWDNSVGTTQHSSNDHDIMNLMNINAAWVELGMNGISGSYLQPGVPDTKENIIELDSEFAKIFPWGDTNYHTARSWGLDDARIKMNAFSDILRHYFDAETCSFPKSFVPPRHAYYWGDNGDGNSPSTLGVALSEFGVKYVNGDLSVSTRATENFINNYIMDQGVIFIDRAKGANYYSEGQTPWYGDWNDFDYPYYPDEGYGWVEANFPNVWSGETIWTDYLKGINNDQNRFLSKNTVQNASQLLYRNYAVVSGSNGSYTIDVTAMPDNVYSNNFLSVLVLKTPLFGYHIQTATINNDAQIVGYYEDDYGYGCLIIGHRTNTMGRLSKTVYTLNTTLGYAAMDSYIDQKGTTYNVYSYNLSGNTANFNVEMYGTQDVKIKLPFAPATVTSGNPKLTVQSWSWASPFVTITLNAKNMQGETGVITITQ